MSILVKNFDKDKAKLELKKCPKIVRDYVDSLHDYIDSWKYINENC